MAAMVLRFETQAKWSAQNLSLNDVLELKDLSSLAQDAANLMLLESAPAVMNVEMQVIIPDRL